MENLKHTNEERFSPEVREKFLKYASAQVDRFMEADLPVTFVNDYALGQFSSYLTSEGYGPVNLNHPSEIYKMHCLSSVDDLQSGKFVFLPVKWTPSVEELQIVSEYLSHKPWRENANGFLYLLGVMEFRQTMPALGEYFMPAFASYLEDVEEGVATNDAVFLRFLRLIEQHHKVGTEICDLIRPYLSYEEERVRSQVLEMLVAFGGQVEIENILDLNDQGIEFSFEAYEKLAQSLPKEEAAKLLIQKYEETGSDFYLMLIEGYDLDFAMNEVVEGFKEMIVKKNGFYLVPESNQEAFRERNEQFLEKNFEHQSIRNYARDILDNLHGRAEAILEGSLEFDVDDEELNWDYNYLYAWAVEMLILGGDVDDKVAEALVSLHVFNLFNKEGRLIFDWEAYDFPDYIEELYKEDTGMMRRAITRVATKIQNEWCLDSLADFEEEFEEKVKELNSPRICIATMLKEKGARIKKALDEGQVAGEDILF